MRQGFDGTLLRNHKGELKGINLGADYCAEHEWGIARLVELLDIGEVGAEYGYALRKVCDGSSANGGIITIKKQKYFYLYAGRIGYIPENERNDLRSIWNRIGKFCYNETLIERSGFSAEWDNSGFHIVFEQSNIDFGKNLLNAIKNGDALVYIGKDKNANNPFSRSGLKVVILSKEDHDVLQQMEDADKDTIALYEAVSRTGIEQELKEAGKRYYALSPKWANEEKTEVVFWLNPMEQSRYNYGWFSIDDLRLWARNEGPIIKEDESREE